MPIPWPSTRKKGEDNHVIEQDATGECGGRENKNKKN